MRHFIAALALVLIAAVASTPAQAAAVTLRIATVAPAGSSFHRSLQQLAADWQRAPGGGVALDIYPGTQGGEAQIARRMRVGQIQGAMLTANGLGQIERDATALQLMPLMFRDWNEVDHVREALRGRLEGRLLEAGYVVLFWGDAGWVRFFSTRPIRSAADLKSMRVYADGSDPEAFALMRGYYTPVPLDPDKILLGLRNGMIDALPVPAFLANFSQVPTYAPYMLDLRWAPITGAMVVTERAWNKLDPATQTWLRETSERAGHEMRRASRVEDEQAVQAMKDKQGLKVVPLTAEAEHEFRTEVARMYPRIRGTLVPAPMFDATVEALKARPAAGS